MQQMAEEDSTYNEAADQAGVATLLSTSAAFHRWQQARLKATFKKQLSEILEDVTTEEKVTKKLRQQLKSAHTREEELLQHVADLKAELEGTAAQNSQQHADIHELTTAVEALEAHAEALEQRATEAEAAHAAEVGHSTVLQQQQLQELRAAKQEQQEVLKQQQTLLDSLAQRDQQVAQLAADLKTAKTAAADAVQQLQRIEGVVQATGERAAAAEDGLKTSNELVVRLQQQLADLKDRYHTELAGLGSLRAAAAESAALKDRLAEASAAAAALAAARDETRSRLDAANAALAAASEQKRQLEQAAQIKKTVQAAGLAGDLVGVLSQQLKDTQAHITALAPKLAAAEAAVQHQQRHIQQLAAELEQAKSGRSAAAERSEVLQVLNVQLQAEVTRLAALAGVQARDWADDTGAAAAAGKAEQYASSIVSKAPSSTALLLSQLQESLDSIEATRRSMSRTRPKTTAAARQATAASALVTQAATLLQQVVATLRPDQQQQNAPVVLAAVVSNAEQQLKAVLGPQAAEQKVVLEDLQLRLKAEQQQWQQVLLAAAAAEKELQDGIGLLSSVHVDILGKDMGSMADTLQSHVQHLRSTEQQLATALERSSIHILEDEVCVSAQVASRDMCATLLELSGLLDSTADLAAAGEAHEPESITTVLSDVSHKLEVAAARSTEKLKAIHSCCVTLSSSLAELSSVTAYLHTAQQQATSAASQLQQLQQLLQEQMQEMHARGVGPAIGQNGGSHTRKVAHSTAAGGVSSDHGAASDAVAALQLEVAALRLQLQMREGEVQQLMTREKQLLSGTHDLVPAELLATAGRRQDELAQQVIALQQQLVQQAAAQQYAAGVYVERVAAQRTVGHLVEGWLRWRTAAVQGRADRLSDELCEAQAALQHSAELQQLRSSALAALLKRQAKAAGWEHQQQLALAVFAAWQRQANRQVQATWYWRGLSQLLLDQQSLSTWAQQSGQCEVSSWQEHQQQRGVTSDSTLPHQEDGRINSCSGGKVVCLAAVMLRRRHNPAGSCVGSVKALQLLSLVFRAWRSWAQLESKTKMAQQKLEYVEQLSSSLPAWVQQLGDKRRLERGWLAWRLAATATARPAAGRARQPVAAEHQATQSTAAAEDERNTVKPVSFGGQPVWQLEIDANVSSGEATDALGQIYPCKMPHLATSGAGGAIRNPLLGMMPTNMSTNTVPTHHTANARTEAPALDGIGQQQQQQRTNTTQQRLQQRLLGVGEDTQLGLRLEQASDSRPHAGSTSDPKLAASGHSAAEQQPQQKRPLTLAAEASSGQAGMLVQNRSRQTSSKQQQKLSLRNRSSTSKTMAGTTAAAAAAHFKSPPAGLSMRASDMQHTGVASPQTVVPRPQSASPGAAPAGGRAAFGRTLRAGDWAPAPTQRAAAAAKGSGPDGKVGVAGLAIRSGRRSPSARTARSAAGSNNTSQQQQQGVEAQQATAADGGTPVASSVYNHLAAISSSLTTMQQQVQVRTRALFQAGTDALHPSVAAIARQQQPEQEQQPDMETLLLLSRQPRVLAGQGLDQNDAAADELPAVTDKNDSVAQGTGTAGNLQQQLMGCQQHLQQLTSSLRIASRPWLYTTAGTAIVPPASAAAVDAGWDKMPGLHPKSLQPASAVDGGSLEQRGIPVAAAAASTASASSDSTIVFSSVSGACQALTGSSAAGDSETSATKNLAPKQTSSAGGSSNEAVLITGGVREGVDVVSLLTAAAAAAANTGQPQEGELTPQKKAALPLGTGRQRSPAVVVDTRSPQVAVNERGRPAAAGGSPSRTGSPAPADAVIPEWQVMGQPRKALVPGAAGTAGSAAAHLRAVPLSTYVSTHNSTPGPGSPRPLKSQQYSTGSQCKAAPAAAVVVNVVAPAPRLAGSSPVPQIATSIPQPYRSAVAHKHPQLAPAQQQPKQVQTGIGDHKSSEAVAAMGQIELHQGYQAATPPPEPGVMRFERISRGGATRESSRGQ